jgi:uncharacterized repeat protein (TIGR02543 family)
MRKSLAIFGGVFIFVIFLGSVGGEPPYQTGSAQSSVSSESSALKVDRAFGRMPLYFISNGGQVDGPVAYYIQGKDKTIYFTSEGLTYVLNERRIGDNKDKEVDFRGKRLSMDMAEHGARSLSCWIVKQDFVGADPNVRPSGEEKTEAVISYFKGSPEEWKTGLSTYSRIIYRNLWPGIDLVYYGTTDRLKYEFIVHPGADPSLIRLAYRGASAVKVNGDGRIEVRTPVRGFEDDVPAAYQEADGERVDVALSYILEQPSEKESGVAVEEAITKSFIYGFEVGDYDRTKPLILDPAVLVYCGYIGGSDEDDYGYGIAVDAAGNAYVTGLTSSTEATFPVTVGPDLTHNGYYDAFVAKVNSSGTALVYCGYIGGSGYFPSNYGYDIGTGIAVDGEGNAYVAGYTNSTEGNFPVTVGPDLTYNGGEDAFVAKVNASGTALVYCGYIGGSSGDLGYGIAVDAAGNAYVTGYTQSTQATFPVLYGPDLTYNGGWCDAFVAKVNASGTTLVYCGYIGGSDIDKGTGIAVDGEGNAYVTGITYSTEATFPVLYGPDLTHNGGYYNAFVAKVNPSGTSLLYCGYIGGSGGDEGWGIAVDGEGNAYVTGITFSHEDTFPVTVGPDLTHNGYYDAFVAKVNSSGTALVYCGYIGGDNTDEGYGIAVDSAGNAYVTGGTRSSEATFPVTVGPELTFTPYAGYPDAFVARVNSSGTALVYCGYIGGSGEDIGRGIAVDSAGNAYVTGSTSSTEATFPVNVGPDLTYNGYGDAFVAKIIHQYALQYALTIAAGTGGTTDPTPGNYTHDSGTQVSITATPSSGYRFSGWSGSATGTTNPITITMDGDKSITANFIRQYTLTIAAGTGGTTDPAPGNYTHDSGTQVSITATPSSGYRFSGWSGSASGTTNPITITMDGDKSITANFILQYTLNTLTIAAGTGGTTDPAPGTYTHDSGTQVSITATPSSGYRFSGWSGSASGTTNPITITMDGDKSITANFIRQYSLTIAAGTGGTTDPAPGTYTHDSGAQVSITATPSSGYRFSGWSGSVTGTINPITITMDSDKSITANFIRQYTLTIAAGTGGTTNPAPGNYTHDSGTQVSITATPSSGYRFTGWSGSATGTSNPITITMDGDKSITANFILQYSLTIAAGTGGTTNPAPGTYTHDSGTQVSITATPSSGYRFTGWSGSVTGTTNPITITMDSDKSITANFFRQYTLTIAAGTGGTTNPAPGNYTHDSGTQVSITATPSSGYKFSGWTGSATGTTNPITITIDSDKSITANFTAITEEGKKKGCFIATAAYGSPLHPYVETLRDFRDRYLIPYRLGRTIVDFYYRYSPAAANFILKHKALKVAAQIILLPIIAFSYTMLRFGPLFTAVVITLILAFLVLSVRFYRRKSKKGRAKNIQGSDWVIEKTI